MCVKIGNMWSGIEEAVTSRIGNAVVRKSGHVGSNPTRSAINKKCIGEKMLNINIVCIGKIKENYLKDAISEYSKRISKYCSLKIIELQDEKLPDKMYNSLLEQTKEKECQRIANNIKKDSYIISLDLKGKELSSEEFSKKIEDTHL